MVSSSPIWDRLVEIEEGITITEPVARSITKVHKFAAPLGVVIEPYTFLNIPSLQVQYDQGQRTEVWECEIHLFIDSYLEGDRRDSLWDEAIAFIDAISKEFGKIENIGLGGAGRLDNSTLTHAEVIDVTEDNAEDSSYTGNIGVVCTWVGMRTLRYNE